MFNDLETKAATLRQTTFEMMLRAGHGHVGSVMSEIEILVCLFYGGVVRFPRGGAKDPKRDRVIISKGHAAMALYPILAELGCFSEEELKRFGTPESLLRAFGNIGIPGIDATSGSLGHGPGIASGYAYAAKQDGSSSRAFVILSEGEMYEGSTWESALFAAHHGLDNLIVVLDRNGQIILGHTEDLNRLEPIGDKWRSFGWEVVETNGHSVEQLMSAFGCIGRTGGKPLLILANTVKGKGISFMENRAEWHYWHPMSEEQVARARADLARSVK